MTLSVFSAALKLFVELSFDMDFKSMKVNLSLVIIHSGNHVEVTITRAEMFALYIFILSRLHKIEALCITGWSCGAADIRLP
jgi:hypothetical protein